MTIPRNLVGKLDPKDPLGHSDLFSPRVIYLICNIQATFFLGEESETPTSFIVASIGLWSTVLGLICSQMEEHTTFSLKDRVIVLYFQSLTLQKRNRINCLDMIADSWIMKRSRISSPEPGMSSIILMFQQGLLDVEHPLSPGVENFISTIKKRFCAWKKKWIVQWQTQQHMKRWYLTWTWSSS